MITREKADLIRKRLLQGVSKAEIAEEFKVSTSTVKRIQKKMPVQAVEQQDTGDNFIKYNPTTLLTKKEAQLIGKLAKEIDLYEDESEGWVFHLTKSDIRLKTSGLWWSAIVYPESAPPDWVEKLRNKGFRIAISPLHDKDFWDHDSPEMVDPESGEIIPKGARYKAGDRKKPHWHVIIVCDQRVSAVDINTTVRGITHGPYLQKCRSLRNAFDYFLHLNAPEKYQGYDKDEIRTFNNFHIEPNKYEVGVLQAEIARIIIEKDLDDMEKVARYFMDMPEYMVILTSKPGFFTSLVHSIWRKKHPEGHIQQVKIVKDDKEIGDE